MAALKPNRCLTLSRLASAFVWCLCSVLGCMDFYFVGYIGDLQCESIAYEHQSINEFCQRYIAEQLFVCTGVKIRAGHGTAAPLHPVPAQQKYVHPNAAKAGRSSLVEELCCPGRRGNAWRGGHSSVSSLVVDTAVGDESSSWQSLCEGSERSTSSEIDMTSPVSVAQKEALSRPVAGPSPGQPPRAISSSPGTIASRRCSPPLDQLLPGPVKHAVTKASPSEGHDLPADVAPAAENNNAKRPVSAKASGEGSPKPAAPLRVLSMNSDRSHAHQSTARVAPAQPAAQSKVQKPQQGSQASAESSHKAGPTKQPAPVRIEPTRSSSAAGQPAGKVRSPQKRSMPPASTPFSPYPPGHPAVSMPAWPHMHQQRPAHMHTPPSSGLASIDTQLVMDVQRQLSALEVSGFTAVMRAPARTQSLPRLQQQQRQAGHGGPMFDQQRQAIMQQMPQMPPSWRQSPQPPADARQPLPKQAAMPLASVRAPRTGGAADMHAPRRHSVPASPVVAAHSGPFAFHPHPESAQFHQLMQQALSHAGFSGQAQPPRSMAMQRQMMGYPAVRPRPSPYADPSLQRQGHGPAVSLAAPLHTFLLRNSGKLTNALDGCDQW